MTTLRQFLLVAILLVIVQATASVINPRFRRADGNYGIYKAGPHDANVQVMTDVGSAASLDGEYKAGPVAQNSASDNNAQAFSNLESQYGEYRAGVADSNAQLKTAPSYSRSRRSYGYNGGSNYGIGGANSYGYGGQQGGHVGGGSGYGGRTPYGRGGFVGNGFSGAGISSGGSQWGSSGSSSVGGWQSGGVGSAMNPNDPNFTGQSPPMAVLPASDQTGAMAGDAAVPPQAATPFIPQPPSSEGGIPPGMAGDPAGR